MQPTARPHVSDAIRQVRGWVTIAATILALCCATQMTVFAFGAYTDARWVELHESRGDKPLRVVGTPEEPGSAATGSQVVGGVRGVVIEQPKANPAEHQPHPTVELNRVHSAAELWLRRASDAAAGTGVIASFVLCVLTMLGVVIAGGGCVPGVERATTAAVWSLILGLMCMPWQRIMPGLGLPGIFASYADMTHAIDTKTLGVTSAASVALMAQWVGAPLVAMFAAMGVGLWFRAGVERGMIVTSMSELDRAVEREAGMIAKRGVASSTPKSVGALNQAIGAGPMATPMNGPRGAPPGTLSAIERQLAESGAGSASGGGGTATAIKPRTQRGVADEDFKRPI